MNTPASKTSWIEILFVGLALVGLLGANVQLGPYLKAGSIIDGNVLFWKETVATAASTFIVVDIFVLSAAVLIWMLGECRRIGLSARWAWGYFLVSLFVAVSFAMPLFFAHRHRRLRLQHPEQAAVPAGADLLGVAVLVALVAAAAIYSFTHIPGG